MTENKFYKSNIDQYSADELNPQDGAAKNIEAITKKISEGINTNYISLENPQDGFGITAEKVTLLSNNKSAHIK